MRRLLTSLLAGGLFLVLLAAGSLLLLSPEGKSRALIRGVGLVQRVLRPLEFKKAYQPLFKRILLFAQQGLGSGRDDMESSGEAGALLAYRERILRGPSDVVVLFDVGAFEGEYTDALLSTFSNDPKVEIHAFEPAAPAFRVLSQKFAGNDRVHPIKAALGDQATTLSLHIDASPKMNSLVERPHFAGSLPTEEVPVLTLDEYCAKNKVARIDLLKLDVEGYEMNVLKGATRMLGTRSIAIIQFEYGVFAITNKVLFHDLFAVLGKDYDIFRIVGDGLEPILPGNGVWEQNAIGGNYAGFLKPQ